MIKTYRTVIETKFFTVGNIFICEHADWVLFIPYFVDRLAIWAATMA